MSEEMLRMYIISIGLHPRAERVYIDNRLDSTVVFIKGGRVSHVQFRNGSPYGYQGTYSGYLSELADIYGRTFTVIDAGGDDG